METIYLAGGCLWGVQAFVKTLPGVIETEAVVLLKVNMTVMQNV